jgi:hypothetical protein
MRLFGNQHAGASGSIYATHPNYLQSKRWRWIRSARLWIDGGRCKACHAQGGLQIHHASYRWFNRWGDFGMVFELLDTITLCNRCHGGVHGAQRIQEFRD